MNKKDKIKILVADDHNLIRKGLKEVLSEEEDLEITQEAENGIEAIQKALNNPLDLIIMDINMPKLNGLKAITEIKEALPNIKIIVLTIHEDKQYLIEAIRAGASGYVLKINAHELVGAIRQVMRDEPYVPNILRGELFKALSRYGTKEETQLESPTKKELEVLKLVAKGLTNKEIAEKLSVSEKTVKNHLTHIFKKCDVSDRTQAVMYAVKSKWIEM